MAIYEIPQFRALENNQLYNALTIAITSQILYIVCHRVLRKYYVGELVDNELPVFHKQR